MNRLLASGLALSAAIAAALFLTSAAAGPKPLASFDPRIKPLLEKMTLDEKIGQMTEGDSGAIKDPADVATYYLGSVLSGGGSDPAEGTPATPHG